VQRREFEENTSVKGTDVSADTEFEDKFQYRKHWKQGWEKNDIFWNPVELHELHHNRVESTIISE